MAKNAIPDAGASTMDVASRIAARSLAKREADYASEIRRLLDAALELIRGNGTSARPRVADIVAAAGLSNDAFYRHFPSKDALVAALVEDGTERLASYLAHQMGKETDPGARVRRWVDGVLSQAEGQIAATTLAVLWNGDSVPSGGRHNAAPTIGALLVDPLADLGSRSAAFDASLISHAALGLVSEFLAAGRNPTAADTEHLVDFCLRACAARA